MARISFAFTFCLPKSRSRYQSEYTQSFFHSKRILSHSIITLQRNKKQVPFVHIVVL